MKYLTEDIQQQQQQRKEAEKLPLEHTTAAIVIRGMRGMSSMGKPVSMRPIADANGVFMGGVKTPPTPPANEFMCSCATGWTGPTCEISKTHKIEFLQLILFKNNKERERERKN